MLNVTIHEEDGVVVLEPHGALTQNDFVAATAIVDPFIERYGQLNGVTAVPTFKFSNSIMPWEIRR